MTSPRFAIDRERAREALRKHYGEDAHVLVLFSLYLLMAINESSDLAVLAKTEVGRRLVTLRRAKLRSGGPNRVVIEVDESGSILIACSDIVDATDMRIVSGPIDTNERERHVTLTLGSVAFLQMPMDDAHVESLEFIALGSRVDVVSLDFVSELIADHTASAIIERVGEYRSSAHLH